MNDKLVSVASSVHNHTSDTHSAGGGGLTTVSGMVYPSLMDEITFTDGQVLVPEQPNETEFKMAVVDYAVMWHDWEIDFEQWSEDCYRFRNGEPDAFDQEELNDIYEQALEWIYGLSTEFELVTDNNQLVVRKA